jgi:hypothetical protein
MAANTNFYSAESFFKVPEKYFNLIGFSLLTTENPQTKCEKLKHFARRCFFFISLASVSLIILSDIIHEIVQVRHGIHPKNTPFILNVPLLVLKSAMIYSARGKINELFNDVRGCFGSKQVSAAKSCDLMLYTKLFENISKGNMVMLVLSVCINLFVFGPDKIIENLWLPFTPGYTMQVLVNIFAMYAAIVSTFMQVGNETIIVTFITLTATAFQNFCETMEQLNGLTDEATRRKLKDLIDEHAKLFELGNKLQATLSSMIFIHFVQSSIIICVCVFETIVAEDVIKKILYASYFFVTASQIFSLCFFGQKIIDASSNISQVAYDSNWYESKDVAVRQAYLLIILRSQRVQKLTAKGFKTISRETFATVSTVTATNRTTFFISRKNFFYFSFFSFDRS